LEQEILKILGDINYAMELIESFKKKLEKRLKKDLGEYFGF